MLLPIPEHGPRGGETFVGSYRDREAVAKPVPQELNTWWKSLGLEVSILCEAIVWLREGLVAHRPL